MVAVLTTALKSCLRAEWWTALFAHGRSQENVLCARHSLKSHRRNLKTMDSKTRGRGNGAQNRAPRSMKSFKCLYKAIDSTAGGQGNDVSKPIAAGYEIIQNHFQDHRLKRRGEEAEATPRDATNRAPRSTNTFETIHQIMDTTAGGQGNDVPEPITAGYNVMNNPIQNHGFKGARLKQRRPEPITAEHDITNNRFLRQRHLRTEHRMATNHSVLSDTPCKH